MDLDRFFKGDDPVAVRFGRADLPGWMSKRLVLPEHHLALVQDEQGQASVLRGPVQTSGADRGVLVKDSVRCDLSLGGFRSKDGLSFSCRLGLALRPRSTPIDLGQLEQAFLKDGEATRAEVQGHFEPYVKDALRLFVGQRSAEALCQQDPRGELDRHLREELKKGLFETGLELEDLQHPALSSSDWEARQAANAEARGRAEALERERAVLEKKKQLDLEALLAGIEVRDEADRARRQKRLERFEQLRAQMGDDERKALVMLIDDDRQRAALIKELIAQDLSPEQRAGIQVSEMERRVEERLKELQQKLAQLGGATLGPDAGDPLTRRILCVVGKRVLAFDPKTNLHPEVPKEVYDTEEGSLGYLRSVRVDAIEGEDWLLVGAQRGLYRINGTIRIEYPFPEEPDGKGGANAAAFFDGRLYATHSEVGLVEWPYDRPDEARIVCEGDVSEAGSVRGVTVLDGKLYFSAGPEVLCLDLVKGAETPVRFKGSDDSITAFAVRRGELVAGNKSGKLYRWSLDDPSSPDAFKVQKRNPIFMLRVARIAGQEFFVIGSKDYTVTAAEPRKDLFREYQCREEVRWVDGAGDFVVGVARSGYKVFCWDVLQQSEPKLTIRVSDKIQDLFVQKMLPQKS